MCTANSSLQGFFGGSDEPTKRSTGKLTAIDMPLQPRDVNEHAILMRRQRLRKQYSPGSNIPNEQRSRADIMKELT